MFLIHGRHARIWDQIFGQGFWPGFWGKKIQCTVLQGLRNTVYGSTGTETYSVTVLPGREKMGETTMY